MVVEKHLLLLVFNPKATKEDYAMATCARETKFLHRVPIFLLHFQSSLIRVYVSTAFMSAQKDQGPVSPGSPKPVVAYRNPNPSLELNSPQNVSKMKSITY